MTGETEITVGGITVPLTHPDKVLFPGQGITKADLARYYADVATWMLPGLKDRPISMVRYPDGLDGERFFQKNAPSYFPGWIRASRWARRAARSSMSSATNPPRWSTWLTRMYRDPRVHQPRGPAGRARSGGVRLRPAGRRAVRRGAAGRAASPCAAGTGPGPEQLRPDHRRARAARPRAAAPPGWL